MFAFQTETKRAPAPTRPTRVRPVGVALLIGCLPLIESCANTIDLKRMTYEALRQADCRENQLDTFCQRTFANEYAEYERQRRHFMRDTTESPWRAHRDTDH